MARGQPKMANNQSTDTLLHRLPPELRSEVYKYYTSDSFPPRETQGSTRDSHWRTFHYQALCPIYKKSNIVLPLLKVDALLYREAIASILARHTFFFTSLRVVKQFSDAERQFITSAGVRLVIRVQTSSVRYEEICSASRHRKSCIENLRHQCESLLRLAPRLKRLRLLVDLDPNFAKGDVKEKKFCQDISETLQLLETIEKFEVRIIFYARWPDDLRLDGVMKKSLEDLGMTQMWDWGMHWHAMPVLGD